MRTERSYLAVASLPINRSFGSKAIRPSRLLAAHDVIANRLDLLIRQARRFRAVQHAFGLGYVRRVGIVRRRRLIGGMVNVYPVRGLTQRRARTANAAT